MPQPGWSTKRQRQYEHIKEGLRERGDSEDVAEEIAARTVNKERARAGEAMTSSRTSIDDVSSSRRGGLRSHREQIAQELAAIYKPSCNDTHYDRSWKDEWIGGYTAPTTGPLTTSRDPGDPEPR